MSTEDMLTELPLATFELPQWLLQPAVRSCRLFNSIHKWIHGPNLAYEKGAEGLKSRWAPTALFRSVWTTILNGSWSIGGASNLTLQAVLLTKSRPVISVRSAALELPGLFHTSSATRVPRDTRVAFKKKPPGWVPSG